MDIDPVDQETDNKNSKEDNESRMLKDVLFSKRKPVPGQTIFFLETKCNCTDSKYSILNFTAHQACSIESAALHHSNFEVFVLFACPTIRQESDPIIEAILSYNNVKLRYVNLWRFGKGTPIEEWIKKNDLFRSRYLKFNISNLLRLLILFRYGGIYFDMDVVVLRSFEDESPNFMGAEKEGTIGNSVIGLETNGFGHEVANLILTDFYKIYMENVSVHNGRQSLARAMTVVCGTNDVNLMIKDPDRCHGIKVFDINAFYEIDRLERTHFFDEKYANQTLSRLKNSYLIHTWNQVDTKWPLSVDSKAPYIQLAAQHCPRVFAATGKLFT
ncbi:lactosylceramide 4-alpha-galactosyltransferase-like [Drosophila innubila]|uniref:lactosylceramide 4-alpha-galactosyltransferase-like n=1 Tax=Drosophila innubila TaxID=198719 RepID=UPI00148BF6D2|nr:lactosylceramide 4-alpha-galactosyltransferase-like [Drosophila innubila]